MIGNSLDTRTKEITNCSKLPENLLFVRNTYGDMVLAWRQANQIVSGDLGKVSLFGCRVDWPDVIIGKYESILPKGSGLLVAAVSSLDVPVSAEAQLPGQKFDTKPEFSISRSVVGPYGREVTYVGFDGTRPDSGKLVNTLLNDPDNLTANLCAAVEGPDWLDIQTTGLVNMLRGEEQAGMGVLRGVVTAMADPEYNPHLTDLAAQLAPIAGIAISGQIAR